MNIKKFTLLFAFFATVGSVFAQPNQPTLFSPMNGASGVAINVTLDWDTVTADSFQVQVSTTSNFLNLVIDSILADTATEFMIPSGKLANNKTYYWRVAGHDANGMSLYSSPFSFTTIQTATSAVSLLSPANSATNVSATGTVFDWSDDSQADNYKIIVARDASLTNVVEQVVVSTSTHTLSASLKNDTTYHWAVISSNGLGDVQSVIFSFKTQLPPPAKVTLRRPAHNSNMVSFTPYLSWDSSAGATNYKIKVSANSNLSSPVLDTTIGKIDSVLVSTGKLIPLTTYYWSVSAGITNSFSEWSDTFSFTTTGLPPSRPSLKSPMSASIGLSSSPTLEWNPVAGAVSYRLHLSIHSNFGDTAYHAVVNAPTTTHMVTDELPAYTVFYWRVAAENIYGLSEPSLAWNFTTLYTGIGSMASDFGMNVYPNPSTEKSFVSFDVKNTSEISVFVSDITGKNVLNIAQGQMEAGKQEISFNTSSLKAGVYFIHITQDGMHQSLKLVVQ